MCTQKHIFVYLCKCVFGFAALKYLAPKGVFLFMLHTTVFETSRRYMLRALPTDMTHDIKAAHIGARPENWQITKKLMYFEFKALCKQKTLLVESVQVSKEMFYIMVLVSEDLVQRSKFITNYTTSGRRNSKY